MNDKNFGRLKGGDLRRYVDSGKSIKYHYYEQIDPNREYSWSAMHNIDGSISEFGKRVLELRKKKEKG